jgi:hypothetical protein
MDKKNFYISNNIKDEQLLKMTVYEILNNVSCTGGKIDASFDIMPFVDWDSTRYLKGQITVGEYTVNCTGMLRDLPKKEGYMIVIVRSDEKSESNIKP